MFEKLLDPETLTETWGIVRSQFPLALWETVYVTVLRSIPFLILMILVFPLTWLLVGTVVGTTASIVPLVITAFPFVSRLAESSLREVNPNLIEMAQSMGASPLQIVLIDTSIWLCCWRSFF